jgi:hypothetical protein
MMLRPNRWLPERHLLRILLLCALLCGAASAQQPVVWEGEIDGVPTWITIVPRGHTIDEETRATSPWWDWGTTDSDAYIFAFERPDTAYLILDFSRTEEGRPRAEVFVADWGKRTLSYTLEGNDLTIRSNGGFPNLILQPREGEWLHEGATNYRLELWEDGYVEAFRRSADPEERIPDGRPERYTQVGVDAEGLPQWETTDRIFDPHPSWGGNRFGASLRRDDAPAFRVTEALMPTFPHLQVSAGEQSWFVENLRPIEYDLRRFELDTNSFIGFQTGGTYWINSDSYPPHVGFESPFAFYSFDPGTRFAHMIIRAESYPAESPFGPDPLNFTRTAFRYSWKTDDDNEWRYGIHVAGPHPYDEEITIGERTFINVSMERLPTWITEKAWPLVTFVEPTEGYPGSEGIYFYNANRPEHLPWLSGASDVPEPWLAAPYLSQDVALGDNSGKGLPPTFRGEYNSAYFREPLLYLSPIDDRMHLLYAEGGVWHLNPEEVLRYHNLDGGPYIDGWTRERIPEQIADLEEAEAYTGPVGSPQAPQALPGEIIVGLYALDGFLLYHNADGVRLRRTDHDDERFRLAPPTDEATWEAFRDTVAPYDQGRNPFDLSSWLGAFPGETLDLRGASLESPVADTEGFSFVLTIDDGTTIGGDLAIPGLAEAEAGRWLVRYLRADDRWEVAPATIALPTFGLRVPPIESYYPTTLTLVAVNPGNVTWSGDLTLQLDGVPLKRWGDVTVPGLGTVELTTVWSPDGAGRYDLTLEVDGQLLPIDPITVERSRRASPLRLLSLTVRNPLTGLLVAALLLFGTIGLARSWRTA